MAAPFLDPDSSLEKVREDLVYLRCRLAKHPLARELASKVAELLAEWSDVYSQQLAHWDAQTAAQVEVNLADDALDDFVDGFDKDLRAVAAKDPDDTRYRLYITGGLAELKRPVLGDELETLRAWPQFLSTEEDPRLVAHRAPLESAIRVADEALAGRAAADAKNAAFRTTGTLAKYVQKVLTARDHIWSDLEIARVKSADASLPREWASGFFKPPRAPTVSEAERKARAEDRARVRQEREELARKRKELSAKLRETQKELAALGKKPR
jgi:hypothetical protein